MRQSDKELLVGAGDLYSQRQLSNDSHKNDSKSYCSVAMAISPHRISLILGRKLELLNVTKFSL